MKQKSKDVVISDYYNNLSKKEKGDMIMKIIQRCHISYSTVTKKIKTDSWNPLEREAILKLFQLDK